MNIDSNLQVDDLLDTLKWIGKTKTELGLSTSDGAVFNQIEGNFFGHPAKGTVYFDCTGANNAKQIVYFIDNSSLSDFLPRLREVFGEPVNSGMEPYVESNGGAVQWYVFDAGAEIIRISQGSKVKYVQVSIVENPQPCDNSSNPQHNLEEKNAGRPWFCSNCGKKNQDTDVCVSCGAPK